MKDSAILVLVILGTYILLPVLILLLRDKVFHRKPRPEKIKEHSRRFQQRLLNPDFITAESRYRHELPQMLKDLYANHKEILRSDFEIVSPEQNATSTPWYVCYYQPIDAEQLLTTWPGREKFLEIADDGAGNAYMVDPTQDDPPVLFHDHETGEVEEASKTLSEFINWPRKSVDE